MTTANEAWMDALIRHQVGLMRLAPGITGQVNKLLNESEDDIESAIAKRYAKNMDPRRLENMLRTIQAARSDSWKKVNKKWKTELEDLAQAEPAFLDETLRAVVPTELAVTLPTVGRLVDLARTTPFEGLVMSDWAKRVERGDIERMEQQIKMGLLQGENVDQIVKRVLGASGSTKITRDNADSITRTAVNAISNAAKQEFYQLNSDILDLEVFLATLDARTTLVCAGNDNKQFPLGQGPIPPLHWRCRSLRLAIINGEVIGERPMKPFTERMLIKEYAEKNDLGKLTLRTQLPRGHKTSFDDYARKRARELTGRVPAKLSYDEWLRRQSGEYQNEVLGPGRAQLFREGMKLDKFTNREGDVLTLDQLRKSDRGHMPGGGGAPPPKQPPAPPPKTPAELEAERKAKRQKDLEEQEAEVEREFQAREEALRKRRKDLEDQEAEVEREFQAQQKLEEERKQAARLRKERDEAIKREQEEMRLRLKLQREAKEREEALQRRLKFLEEQEAEAKREAERQRKAAAEAERIRFNAEAAAKLAKMQQDYATRPKEPGSFIRSRVEIDQKALDQNGIDEVLSVMDEAGWSRLHQEVGGKGKIMLLDDMMRFEEHRHANGLAWQNTGNIAIRTRRMARMEHASWTVDSAVSDHVQKVALVGVHEFGHNIHLYQGGWAPRTPSSVMNQIDARIDKAFKSKRATLTEYANTNHKEYWAESFAKFHHDPDWLLANHPDTYEMVQDVLRWRKMPTHSMRLKERWGNQKPTTPPKSKPVVTRPRAVNLDAPAGVVKDDVGSLLKRYKSETKSEVFHILKKIPPSKKTPQQKFDMKRFESGEL